MEERYKISVVVIDYLGLELNGLKHLVLNPLSVYLSNVFGVQ